ncbi:RrF2 family transcriptional regulator [Achromobacter deleyi]|uniref:RrF2 family transcriptional regulator n=1 Tax=Achromobacter deleyi TaxID=1353891 RepID=UPI001491AF59|nr:Rrf2 family transcriptional regulator [Achromobacter deleyi]QVQ26349.1 Rrf2 family transcriptional regulator [Achromobacter deleyi]UIP21915.1 Rrf2 family transcriptional regulator [Achromobacter deleyi]
MTYDTRLARLLHVLIHMFLRGGMTTSATLAQMLHTNEVVVRRTMAALRAAGMVTSTGGRNGGWALAKDLDTITVRDVFEAISHGAVFAIGPADDNPACPVERVANQFVANSLHEAEQTLLEHLGAKLLSDLAAEIVAR